MGLISEGNGTHQYLEQKEVGMHKCNSDDFANMKVPYKGSKNRIERLNETESLFCFDKNDSDGNPVEIDLFGMNDNVVHKRIEVIFMPCITYRERTIDKTSVTCNGTLDNFDDVKKHTE